MRLKGTGLSRLGAVRIEYVVAAVICTALLGGMSAVLVRFSQMNKVGQPIRPIALQQQQDPEPDPQPAPQQPRPAQPQPQPQPQAQVQQPRPQQPSTPAQQQTRQPVVVVTPITTEQTPSYRPPARGSIAYPSGEPRIISSTGRTRIEAENYDLGGEGVAYHDTTTSNSGGAYRPHEGVDISLSQDVSGEHVVSHTQPGEWMNYAVSVARSGNYQLQVRAARREAGNGKIRIYFDGVNKTGDVQIPSTGDADRFTTYDGGTVELAAGEQVMRIEMVTGDTNLNWIELTPRSGGAVVSTPQRVTVTPAGTSTANTTASGVRVQPIEVKPAATPAPAAAMAGLRIVAREGFDEMKVGSRLPEGGLWRFNGSVTVQQAPGENHNCLRLVDISRTGDCWVGQEIPAQSETLAWNVRVRFNTTASEFGLTLVEDNKQAVFIYTKDNQIGYEDDGGKWHALTRYEANTWYDIRIEANVKDKSFRLLVNNVPAGNAKLKFRNSVSKINGWLAGTSPALTGTMYIDSIHVEGK